LITFPLLISKLLLPFCSIHTRIALYLANEQIALMTLFINMANRGPIIVTILASYMPIYVWNEIIMI